MKKRGFLVYLVLFIFIAMNASAFEDGFVWGLKANFSGSATLPSINNEDLDKLGAAFMRGGMGFFMDGEAELGYVFGMEKWFPGLKANGLFSGISVYGSIGVGNGGANEIAGNTINGNSVTMYINIEYTPVVTMGIGTKAYFLDNRLSTGLWLGSKLIADTAPSYLAYSDDKTVNDVSNFPEVGEIIVDDWMIKNMNPASFSVKANVEYHQPINYNVRMTLGIFGRFNLYTPKYITMPESLMTLLKAERPNFTKQTRLNSFFLNSLDFGVSLGLSFRGSVAPRQTVAKETKSTGDNGIITIQQ